MEINLFMAIAVTWIIESSYSELQVAVHTVRESSIALTQAPLMHTNYSSDVEWAGGLESAIVPEELESREITDADLNEKCYENVEQPLWMNSRLQWERDEGPRSFGSTVKYVVVRGGGRGCSTRQRCLGLLRSMRGRRKGCELPDNFYVGGDGSVYEGRGWGTQPYWHLRGLRNRSMTVHFLSPRQGAPSAEELEGYRWLIKVSLLKRKLTTGYAVISMGRLLNDSRFSSVELQQAVDGWESSTDVETLSHLWAYARPQRLRMVFREDWRHGSDQKAIMSSSPLDEVGGIMISESGVDCSSRAECMTAIEKQEKDLIRTHGELSHNFYITEDGSVLEGRGWDYLPRWWNPGGIHSYVVIELCGNFTHRIPSEEAINSLKLLVASGVDLGKVKSRYVLWSMRQLYEEEEAVGEALQRYIEGWEIWSEKMDPQSIHDTRLLALSRRFGPDDRYSASVGLLNQAEVVMVDYGGERCFTQSECKSKINEMPPVSDYRSYLIDDDPVIYNYYIGEDGWIYEGRGRYHSQWAKVFGTNSLMTIKFLGSFEKERPSTLAIHAFNVLLKYAAKSELISKQYKLISFRQSYRVEGPVPVRGLEGYLSTLKAWTSNFTLKTQRKTEESGNTHRILYPIDSSYRDFFMRNGYWGQGGGNFTSAVEYVAIGEFPCWCRSKPCFYVMEDCFRYRRSNLANFYISYDGWAYEDLGWKYMSQWKRKAFSTNFMSIRFIGNFSESLPSRVAMMGFHHLMKRSVETGKLASDYKIVSFRQISPDSYPNDPGVMLWEDMKTWDRWSDLDTPPV